MIKNAELVGKGMETRAPKGTRDFLPQEMVRRRFVIDTIRRVYERYGFEPMDMPVFEDFAVLKAKSGEEVKKQIYYFKDKAGRELGLRFDLTVGTARVIAENPELPKPIKRYIIDKAWRYEEISKGRYREFVQADVDIFGVEKPEADAECVACVVSALKTLGIKNLKVRLNSRRIWDVLLRTLGLAKKSDAVLRAVDKLDKIGESGVKAELGKVVSKKDAEKIIFFIRGKLKVAEVDAAAEELSKLKDTIAQFGVRDEVVIDYSLARGLGYYTGTVVEVLAEDYGKSVAGGGRYDNLIGVYGKPLPAIGLSIGVERVIEIMNESGMFEKAGIGKTSVQCFVAPVGPDVFQKAAELAQVIRQSGTNCMLDLQARSLSKNLEYCNSKGIPKMVIVGPKDLAEDKVTVRDLVSGKEQKVEVRRLLEVFE
jgi:histidyl-tRNA synthetase